MTRFGTPPTAEISRTLWCEWPGPAGSTPERPPT